MFEGNKLLGELGKYPLTVENLTRVGMALCTYLKIEEVREPTLKVDELNFLTLSLSVGFMACGGNVSLKEGDLEVKTLKNGLQVSLEPFKIKLVENILFGRAPIPRERGERVGKFLV